MVRRDNALRNGVADRVEVRRSDDFSDVFSNVDGIFDLIVFDPPFRWFAPRDLLEGATTDENYGAMTRFFHQARRHPADGGRMLIFFSTSGDLTYLQQLIDHEGFQSEVVARRSLVEDGWKVDYFTFAWQCDQRSAPALRELIDRLCRRGAACSAPTHLRRVAAGGDPAARRGVAAPAGVEAVPGWVHRWAWPTARGRHDRAWAEGRVGR
jgi:hypothetical protein